MGWANCGTDDIGRDIGYGAAATCDHPGCATEIHRGLAYVCGSMHGGGQHGCGKYFCYEHLFMGMGEQFCPECFAIRDSAAMVICPRCAEREVDCDDGFCGPCSQAVCQHVWVGHKNPDTADGPGDYIEYCKICGMENPGSWVPED